MLKGYVISSSVKDGNLWYLAPTEFGVGWRQKLTDMVFTFVSESSAQKKARKEGLKETEYKVNFVYILDTYA